MQARFDTAKRISEIINICKHDIENIFNDTSNYFSIFYGSYAYQTASPASDLDILVVSDRPDKERIEKLKTLIFNIHQKFGMPLDFDIPYEDKVHRSLDFMKAACSGAGIYTDNNWAIPPFEKKKETLTTDLFLKRFFVAMMMHPHIFITGNSALYCQLRGIATRNMIRAIVSINGLNTMSLSQFIKCLCGQGIETGEMFIGFKHTDTCYAYLTEYLSKVFLDMGIQAKTEEDDKVYDFDLFKLLRPETILC